MIVYIVVTTLLKLSKSWFQIEEMKHRLTQIEKENINSELKALKAQINPHFLFNSLNVLYSLAIKESVKTPGAIIQLSDILRYVIYDSSKENVTLKDEIKLIEEYIGLQKYRIDKSSKVTFTHTLDNKKQKIAPMLFLPLIENSFKHGLKGDLKNTFLDINLTSNNDSIIFNIQNNRSEEGNKKDDHSGIGLKNVKSRLELIYPERHKFEISDKGETFSVELKIKL
jgi:LytS/YehU family sensor histidine kinase